MKSEIFKKALIGGLIMAGTSSCSISRDIKPVFIKYNEGYLVSAHGGFVPDFYIERKNFARKPSEEEKEYFKLGYGDSYVNRLFWRTIKTEDGKKLASFDGDSFPEYHFKGGVVGFFEGIFGERESRSPDEEEIKYFKQEFERL